MVESARIGRTGWALGNARDDAEDGATCGAMMASVIYGSSNLGFLGFSRWLGVIDVAELGLELAEEQMGDFYGLGLMRLGFGFWVMMTETAAAVLMRVVDVRVDDERGAADQCGGCSAVDQSRDRCRLAGFEQSTGCL
ncbi:hypothetical protein M0R45_030450 [Rubus argutus]|uniref:Uncharacterized protein n=1 Tax=Rubus argutus TaxID=59490 RepID=A0AAW1WE74_RUBAR